MGTCLSNASLGNHSMGNLCITSCSNCLYVVCQRIPFLRISSACDGALPIKGRDKIKTGIDILIVLGIVGGVATTLGLGVPLVSAMIATLFEVEDSMLIKISVLAFWTALFGTSVYKGLKAGIKILPTSMLFSLSLRFFLYLSQGLVFLS